MHNFWIDYLPYCLFHEYNLFRGCDLLFLYFSLLGNLIFSTDKSFTLKRVLDTLIAISINLPSRNSIPTRVLAIRKWNFKFSYCQ